MELSHNFFLQPSGLNNTFHGGHISFQDYTQHTQAMVAAARTDLAGKDANKVMLANGAYEWRPEKPTKNGVLLVHGLYDSPFTLREIGQHFLQQNFLVRSVLLPGHGTVPGDLLKIDYQEWIKAVAYGANNLSQTVENVYLVGFSLGATLAIYQALQQPSSIKALLLFAPALKSRHYVGFALAWHRLLGTVYKPLQWYHVKKQTSYAKYESFPCNAAYQSLQLMQATKKLAKKNPLTMPIFIATSQDDESVSPHATLDFFLKNSNPCNQLLLYTNATKKLDNSQIIYKSSAYPKQNILNFSHIAIPISPLNPHYGMHGDYKDLYPYNNNNDEDEPLYFGAISPHNIKKYHMQRLSYNPDFAGMMQHLNGFLNRIS